MGRRSGRNGDRDRSPDTAEARGIIDNLTSVDDILRETNKKLDELTTAISQEQPPLTPDTPEGGYEPPTSTPASNTPPTYPYDYSQVVDAQTFESEAITETFVAPSDGVIRRVVLGWPAGTQQAVGIGLRDADGSSLIPRGPSGANFLAYDDQVLSFAINANVQDDDEIEIRYINNDNNDHFVNVEIFHQEREDDAS